MSLKRRSAKLEPRVGMPIASEMSDSALERLVAQADDTAREEVARDGVISDQTLRRVAGLAWS